MLIRYSSSQPRILHLPRPRRCGRIRDLDPQPMGSNIEHDQRSVRPSTRRGQETSTRVFGVVRDGEASDWHDGRPGRELRVEESESDATGE